MATVFSTWFYAIQVFTSLNENRFVVMQNNENFRTSCLAPTECSGAKLSMYLSQHTNNMRQVKIGFHDDYYDKTFYLTASNEVGKEGTITATEDFDVAILFEMTVKSDMEIEAYDPISKRYLHAMPTAECAVGELVLIDGNDAARNESTLKIYNAQDGYFSKQISCC
ncbi:uncharacterized protein [Dysidea avara]|uniref:uncharacterized protein n=1 Tax=Dysidea avara TaxID=196820 RepID=UPI00332C1C40